MSCFRLTPEQQKTLLEFIRGDVVHDLGCGDLRLARIMAPAAIHVHAVDKEKPEPQDLAGLPANVTFHRSLLKDYEVKGWLDCAVVCWPVTCKMEGLLRLVERAHRVVYIGCNTGGSACGPHDLWLHLSKRMLAHEVRDRRNCLHCYSVKTHGDPQFRSEEEIAGLLNENGRFRSISYDRLMVGELTERQLVVQLPA